VQRSPTLVVNVEPSAQLPYALYDEAPSLEDCDLITMSVPIPLAKESHVMLTEQAKKLDQKLLGADRQRFPARLRRRRHRLAVQSDMFSRTPQPGLWFIAGSFAQCRIYSKVMALQIKACELGLIPSALPAIPASEQKVPAAMA
jgi:hypothetical protein